MLTNFKKEDINKILDKEVGFFNEMDLVADKLRTIYTTLGWTHMTTNFSRANETIEELTEHTLKRLLDLEDVRVSSAGLCIYGYFDSEGFINMDYSFVLI